MPPTVLIADDETTIRETLAEVLRESGYDVVTACDGLQAVQFLENASIDIALLDIRMPGMDGMQVLTRAQTISPQTLVIIITAFGTINSAVEAVKLGASDYVSKPVVFDDIIIKIDRLLNMNRLTVENRFLLSELENRYRFDGIVGASAALHRVLDLVEKLAGTRTSALIAGESGTGKELIARAIHYGGITKKGRFVAINSAALSENLVESELFGHRRGSFTGAGRDKPGLFELANAGTVFLDEIGNMSASVQAKLLRVIEDKQILPVGGTTPIEVDARVLCATNHDLAKEVEKGNFREDLYYRLNVVELHIPPLRERREDIPELVDHFVRTFNGELNKACPGMTDAAMRAMLSYSWPGNVRELKNVIERAIIFADDAAIDVGDLAFVSKRIDRLPAVTDDLKGAMRAYERQHILQTLRNHAFDKKAAADALNVGLSSLYRKLTELGIADEPSPAPSDTVKSENGE